MVSTRQFAILFIGCVLHYFVFVRITHRLPPSHWQTKPYLPGAPNLTLGIGVGQIYFETMTVVFLLLTIDAVCNSIFVPALDFMSQKVESGVKGAVFLSIGSSAPEFFTSVAGLLTSFNVIVEKCSNETNFFNCTNHERLSPSGASTGMATIAGSAIVNILIVMAACTWSVSNLSANNPRSLPQPLCKASIERDILFYILSIGLMLKFFLSSQSSGEYRLYFMDVSMLVLLYAIYILKCYTDGSRVSHDKQRIGVRNLMRMGRAKQKERVASVIAEAVPESPESPECLWDHYVLAFNRCTFCDVNDIEFKFDCTWNTVTAVAKWLLLAVVLPVWVFTPFVETFIAATTSFFPFFEEFEEVSPSFSLKKLEMSTLKQVAKSCDDTGSSKEAEMERVRSALYPDVTDKWYFKHLHDDAASPADYERWSVWFWALMTCSFGVLMLGILSYILVAIVEHWGEYFGIPVEFLGITILALGTSIPDIAGSVAVMKKHGADAAISSAFGSNTFDICIGLGVVYWVKLLVIDYAYFGSENTELSILDVYVNIGPVQSSASETINTGAVMLQSFIAILLVVVFAWRLLCLQPTIENRRRVTFFRENVQYRWENCFWIIKEGSVKKFVIPCVVGYGVYVLYFGLVVFLPNGKEISWGVWSAAAATYSCGILVLVYVSQHPNRSSYNPADFPGFGFYNAAQHVHRGVTWRLGDRLTGNPFYREARNPTFSSKVVEGWNSVLQIRKKANSKGGEG